MGLIPCKKCGRMLSDKALKCPGCGWEVEKQITNEKIHANTQKSTITAEPNKSQKKDSIVLSKTNLISISVAIIAVICMIVAIVYAVSYKHALEYFKTETNVQPTDIISSDINKALNDNVDKPDDIAIINDDVAEANEANTNINDEIKQEHDDFEDTSEVRIESDKSLSTSDQSNQKDTTNCRFIFEDEVSADLDFEITGYDTKGGHLYISFKVTNNESKPLHISSQSYQYFDDLAVKRDSCEIHNPIPGGKSSVCEMQFYKNTLKDIAVNEIRTLTLEMFIKDDDGTKHNFEVVFEDVNIKLES